jgi:hypothetical protein
MSDGPRRQAQHYPFSRPRDSRRRRRRRGRIRFGERVIRDALRDWKEKRNLFGYTLEELRALVKEGDDSGPPKDGPSTMEELKAKARARFAGRQ